MINIIPQKNGIIIFYECKFLSTPAIINNLLMYSDLHGRIPV